MDECCKPRRSHCGGGIFDSQNIWIIIGAIIIIWIIFAGDNDCC